MECKKELKLFLVLSAMAALLVLATSCDLTPTQKEQMKAEILKVAAKDATILFLKNNPKYKSDIVEANNNIIDVLQSGKIPTYRHLAVFLAMFKIKPEMQVFAQDLYSLFVLYVNLSGKDPIAMLSRKDMMYLLSFCAGIKEGSK